MDIEFNKSMTHKEHRRIRAKLTEGAEGKIIINLTIPMIWGLFSVIATSVVDTYFVGQLGTLYLAAISFTFPVVLVAGSISLGLGAGVASIVSRAIGEGDQTRVRRYTTDSLVLSFLIVAIITGLGYFTIDPLFKAMGAHDDVMPMIRDYMKIWYLGTVFIVLPMVGNSVIRATGDAKFPSLIMTVSAFVNIALDPIFIFGLFGFPRLEMQGAAIASLLARATTFLAALSVLHFRERLLIFSTPKLSEVFHSWKQTLYIGLPAVVTNLIAPVSTAIITKMIASYGPSAVAAFGVASRIEGLMLIPIMALASSMGPFSGQNWGAQKLDRISEGLRFSRKISIYWGLFLTVLLGIFAAPIVSVFDKNPEVIHVAQTYFWTVPISYIFMSFIMVSNSSFNACGRPLSSLVFSVLRMFVLYIPIAYFANILWGVVGVFLACAIANVLVGLASLWWFKKIIEYKKILSGGVIYAK